MANLMATGYVHQLIDRKLNFEQYAMQCARAFSALVEMRDDANDAPIPERFEVSDYHVKGLEKSRAELARLSAMNEPTRLAFGETRKIAEIDRLMKSRDDLMADVAVCNDMLARVAEWSPPSPDHVKLKDFMREQIETSVGKDPATFYNEQIEQAKATPSLSFWNKAVASEQWSIEYHTKERIAEVERVENRNLWLRQLRESLA